ncbi:MAG: hypothetical protein LBU42_06185 [Prevotellaceae bacterium]|jgi:hypothetical protein|nr:hypothetical protein [Prevotellaceae bacterium]
MKKTCFLFAMLVSVTTNAQTNVEPVSANYTDKTVSFRVWWNAGSRNATHLSKVWVWVDYITVNSNNTTLGNSWTRAAVSAASPTASVTYDGSNRQGFWLQGNSGSYSATVTVQLNITASKFNWCAYVSDYPPNVASLNGSVYTLKGSPPFVVNGGTISGNTFTGTINSLTDATGCPGIGSPYCSYTGSDLYMDVTHLCQQRTSGAKNWEAYIKDSRDNQIYRITQFSDDNWWFADDLAIADKSVGTCNGKRYYSGNDKPTCPSGWQLPTITQALNKFTNPTTGDPYGATLEVGCYFGVSGIPCGITGCDGCGGRYDLIGSDAINSVFYGNNGIWYWNCGGTHGYGANQDSRGAARARCIRNL